MTFCNRQLKGFDPAILYKGMDKASRDLHMMIDQGGLKEIGFCDFTLSPYYGQYVSYEKCIDMENAIENPLDNDENYEPWIVPVDEDFKMLGKNPGLWVKDHFLTQGETAGLLELVNKYEEVEVLAKCGLGLPEDSQSSVNKDCFHISRERACTGALVSDETCTHTPGASEGDLIDNLIQKAKDAISVDLPVSPYLGFYVARGDTPPQGLHEDVHDIITFAVYLSTGGGATVFPAMDAEVVPNQGSAAMWLNFHKDGTTNTKAFHGVGAQPSGIGERIIILIEFQAKTPEGTTIPPQEAIPLLDLEKLTKPMTAST